MDMDSVLLEDRRDVGEQTRREHRAERDDISFLSNSIRISFLDDGHDLNPSLMSGRVDTSHHHLFQIAF